MQEGELLALLRDEQAEEDRMIQTDISDEDLLKLMDRSDLTGPPGAHEEWWWHALVTHQLSASVKLATPTLNVGSPFARHLSCLAEDRT